MNYKDNSETRERTWAEITRRQADIISGEEMGRRAERFFLGIVLGIVLVAIAVFALSGLSSGEISLT